MTTKTIYTTFPEPGSFAKARFSCNPKDLDDCSRPKKNRYKSRTVITSCGDYFPSCAGPGGDGFRLHLLSRGRVVPRGLHESDFKTDAETLLNWLVDE